MITLFIDESGKTGSQRYTGEWNFANQPYFVLCGIIIDNENIESLNKWIKDLCSMYKIQGRELKSTKSTVKKNFHEIIIKLLEAQKKFSYELIVEIANKKFCIAMMISNYCIFPYYDIDEDVYNSYEANFLRRCFANYVYESVSDDLLGEYVSFFDSGQQDISKLQTLCEKLITECNNDTIKEYIDETIDSFTKHDKLGLSLHNVFPLLDYYKGGISPVAVCPHINSFNNILNRIKSIQDIEIIHDEISDLEMALRKDFENYFNNDSSDILKFKKSDEVFGLQLSDLWGGYIRETVQKFFSTEDSIPDSIVEILQTNVNLVAPFSEQAKLFPNNLEIAQWEESYKDFFR